MKEVINKLIEHKPLGREEASNILKDIASSKYNPSQIAAFLTTYMMRSITVEELSGFRDALLELCIHIDLSAYDAIDLCGTGGDGKDTFNISTLASFVTSGAGVKVAKHGNYGVSSVCGSSNVLEHFGLKFTIDKSILEKQISEAGICFLHAPLFHPAMKNVAPIRKELGVKTFFNMLGPMVNPSFPKKQLVGVFNLELARLYSYLYQQTDMDYVILHGLDGYDEISLTSDFKLISKDKEQILNAADLKLEVVQASDLFGGSTVEEAAKLFNNILDGNGTQAQNQVVIANAAMAIHCANKKSIEESVDSAKESLESGKALESFNKLLSI
ncbi:MAG: anthranilate phosphoribosyltransferase [Bacteroidia bacterium]|nr:anthranilate phosphoribosyltransferase [Bacteroidia bacterium]